MDSSAAEMDLNSRKKVCVMHVFFCAVDRRSRIAGQPAASESLESGSVCV
jgi:hypothetical protein